MLPSKPHLPVMAKSPTYHDQENLTGKVEKTRRTIAILIVLFFAVLVPWFIIVVIDFAWSFSYTVNPRPSGKGEARTR